MLLLVTRTHPEVERLRRLLGPGLGRLVVPIQISGVERTARAGIPWAADNGAFGTFDRPAFESMVDRIAGLPGCRFVAAPDVVADAAATLDRWHTWAPYLLERGLPPAFVAQDGLELDAVPWSTAAAIFIGGSTEWKLSDHASAIAREAKRRGLWLHVGRVNSVRRARHCRAIGADSIDGSKIGRFPDTYLHIARMILALPEQTSLAG